MARSIHGFIGEDEGWVNRFVGLWRDLAGGGGGSIGSWVRGAISPLRGGDEDGDRFVSSWCDLANGRGGSISSWVRGAISPSRGGDEDGDLTNAISN